MGKPRIQTVPRKIRGWEPTLTQIAHRANDLWHHDGCPATSELGYWLRARQELKQEYSQMMSLEESTVRAMVGIEPAVRHSKSSTKRATHLRA
jgi:hypothetical protein